MTEEEQIEKDYRKAIEAIGIDVAKKLAEMSKIYEKGELIDDNKD